MPGIRFGNGEPVWIWCLLLLVTVWSLLWKGLALWHAARERHMGWFIVILLFNTVGILELIYLFAILRVSRAQLFTSKQ